tara:strand:- start:528 stop:719 length:192 start_codon:yes stop_codon:yes gene_type:complete
MKEIILIIGFGFLSIKIQAQELISKWSFDQLKNPLVIENTTNKTDQLLGFYDSVSGIKEMLFG